MRVKGLASKCNDFTIADFALAMKVLYRLQGRGEQGIEFRRGGAATVRVPPNRRLKEEDGTVVPYYIGADDLVNEFGTKDLYRDQDSARDAALVYDFPVATD